MQETFAAEADRTKTRNETGRILKKILKCDGVAVCLGGINAASLLTASACRMKSILRPALMTFTSVLLSAGNITK